MYVRGNYRAGPHMDFNAFSEVVEAAAENDGVKLMPKRWKRIQTALAVKDETAEPVIKKLYKPGIHLEHFTKEVEVRDAVGKLVETTVPTFAAAVVALVAAPDAEMRGT